MPQRNIVLVSPWQMKSQPVVLETGCIRLAIPSQAKIGATGSHCSPKRMLTVGWAAKVSAAMPGMVTIASNQFVRM